MIKVRLILVMAVVYASGFSGCASSSDTRSGHTPHLSLEDEYTLVSAKHLVRDYAPLDSSGNLSVVVEIPTGTNAKWEVNKNTGNLEWDFKNDKPRIISYLGYPGNYGMVPNTLLPKELGGDGDPLDVLVLGPALPRGSVVHARAIGILKMLDHGEQDDKIIAVLPESGFGKVSSIEELRQEFNGVTEIIEIWFSNYKGPGKMKSLGFTNVAEAQRVIKTAIEAYTSKLPLTP